MSKQDFGPNYSLADVRGTPEHRIAELEADVRLAINQRDQAKADFANMATHPSNPLYAENQRLRKALRELVTPSPFCDEWNGHDIHEEAVINASALGREEPNTDDYEAALITVLLKAKERE